MNNRNPSPLVQVDLENFIALRCRGKSTTNYQCSDRDLIKTPTLKGI